jgi:phosphopantothenoylcysteine decarboxylase/phosphopantothenate--cysteine ligase
MELQNKTVLLGVGSSVSIYKACELTRRLRREGADVHVVMTPNATKLIAPQLFGELSQNPVSVEMFRDDIDYDVRHIALAEAADLAIVAPATANVIGKLACGIADDMLTTTLMAIPVADKPVYLAPAMNTHMYDNPIVERNLATLRDVGYQIIEPAIGALACGTTGRGKLASPANIVEYVRQH